MENLAKIELALERLLSRPDSDSFLIVTHQASGKFVQFTGNASGSLLLDLPTQTLNKVDLGRAIVLFRELGVELEEWPVFDPSNGDVAGMQSGFQLEMGRDSTTAARLAVRILTEIFRVPRAGALALVEN